MESKNNLKDCYRCDHTIDGQVHYGMRPDWAGRIYPTTVSLCSDCHLDIENEKTKMIEQIDGEEFKAAVKQLRLGNLESGNEFVNKWKALHDNKVASNLNVARAGYVTGFILIEKGRHEFAAICLRYALDLLLGLKVEEKS